MSFMIAAWLGGLASTAGAQSLDVELLRPESRASLLGADLERPEATWRARVGTTLQYQQGTLEPLDADDVLLGSALPHRVMATVDASVDVGPVTASVGLPAAATWGHARIGGLGLGDLAVGARWRILRTPRDHLALGVQGGLRLATGQRNAWLGEGELRLEGGVLAAARLGALTLAGEAGLRTRRPEEGWEGTLPAGPDVLWSAGARLDLPDATRVALVARALGRARWREAAEPVDAIEGLLGVDVHASRSLTLGVGGGRRLLAGFGTTDLRVVGRATWSLGPPPEAPRTWANTPPPPPPEPAEDEVGSWVDWELWGCAYTVDRLVIRQIVTFPADDAGLDPAGELGVEAVARILHATPAIGFLVVEGHASGDQDPQRSFQLAEERGPSGVGAPARARRGVPAHRVPQRWPHAARGRLRRRPVADGGAARPQPPGRVPHRAATPG